ncbi:MAG: hypothetical protein ABJB04_06555 [Betaproteobacteria bacterium]
MVALCSPLAPLAANAASISTYDFSLGGTDSLTSFSGSIVASTMSNRFLRYRTDANTISKMATDVPPNTNLVATGTNVWFTSREKPFQVGRADLSTVTGSPVYFTPPGISAAFDDMTLGADNALWATSALSGRVARITQSGTTTSFSGNGAIHPVGIARANDGNLWFADDVNRRITRIDASTNTFTDYSVPQISGASAPERIASVPGSALIWFATQDGFGSVDPASGAVRVVATEAQQPKRLAAGLDGTLWLTNGTQYVTQFTPPANYATLKVFENNDAQSAGLYVDPTGVVYVSDPQGWKLARIATADQTPADTTIVEFYNQALDHYFITANAAEATAIDAGSAGPGWSRTGEAWKGWVGGPIPNAAEVCRFYGTPDIDPASGQRRGPNSHFYTVQPGECASVKLDPGWQYEFAGKFWMMKPTSTGATGCPSATQAVYRTYNNRFAQIDSNHRYMTDPTLYSQMLARGWTGEGVVMCAPEG